MVAGSDVCGKWLAVEVHNGDLGLIRVEDSEVGGSWVNGVAPSLRKWLDRYDSRGRALLVDLAKAAVERRQDATTRITIQDEAFESHVRLIWSPEADPIVLGALVGYCRLGQEMPAEPLYGTWYWRVRRDGGGNFGPGSLASCWDGGLYRAYGISAAEIDPEVGPSQHWLAKCLAPHSIADVKLAVDSGIQAAPGELQRLGYDIIRQDTGVLQHMRMYARTYEDPHPEALTMRGVSFVANKRDTTVAVARREPRLEGLVAATFSLAASTAIAAIDLGQDFIFERSPNWAGMNLSTTSDSLGSLAHGPELAALNHYLDTAALSTDPQPRQIFPLITATGGTTPYWVEAVGVDVNLDAGRYVVFSLMPATTEGN